MVKRVPQIEHLRVKELINFASENCDIKSYLPDYDYDKEPQREWLWNIINTLVPEQFHAFVSMALQSREKKLIAQKDLKVNALPQLLDLFSKSKNLSIFNGRSHFLLRDAPRKRKVYEMETDNSLLKAAQSKIKELENKTNEQYNQLTKYEETQESLLKDKEKLCKLYEMGYINSDGEPTEERE